MSSKDATKRAKAAVKTDKGWDVGVDKVSKDGISGSAGIKVYETKGGRVKVGAGASISQDFHGGKPKAAAGVGVKVKLKKEKKWFTTIFISYLYTIIASVHVEGG